ncbi:MAG: LysM domain-containing protein, partial [Elusimicrobiota bacterium]
MTQRLLAAALAFLLVVPASASSVTSERMQNVVVAPGDTLWSISNKWLADPTKWDEILKHNRLPSTDPTVALPGMTLRVPVKLIKVSMRAAHLTYFVNLVTRRAKDT